MPGLNNLPEMRDRVRALLDDAANLGTAAQVVASVHTVLGAYVTARAAGTYVAGSITPP